MIAPKHKRGGAPPPLNLGFNIKEANHTHTKECGQTRESIQRYLLDLLSWKYTESLHRWIPNNDG